jgi:hypothetical protein
MPVDDSLDCVIKDDFGTVQLRSRVDWQNPERYRRKDANRGWYVLVLLISVTFLLAGLV